MREIANFEMEEKGQIHDLKRKTNYGIGAVFDSKLTLGLGTSSFPCKRGHVEVFCLYS